MGTASLFVGPDARKGHRRLRGSSAPGGRRFHAAELGSRGRRVRGGWIRVGRVDSAVFGLGEGQGAVPAEQSQPAQREMDTWTRWSSSAARQRRLVPVPAPQLWNTAAVHKSCSGSEQVSPCCQYRGQSLAVDDCDGEGGMAQGAGWLDAGDWFAEGDAQATCTISGHGQSSIGEGEVCRSRRLEEAEWSGDSG
jgi:hypothetical protein